MVRLSGWLNPLVAESYEMLLQNDSPYLFSSTKFAKEFGFAGTPYADGIRTTAASFKRDEHCAWNSQIGDRTWITALTGQS
jgi:hypothetical protein